MPSKRDPWLVECAFWNPFQTNTDAQMSKRLHTNQMKKLHLSSLTTSNQSNLKPIRHCYSFPRQLHHHPNPYIPTTTNDIVLSHNTTILIAVKPNTTYYHSRPHKLYHQPTINRYLYCPQRKLLSP